ncbi:4-(cytidine 5'-diphospho)-2-C-methyl-D-erythritol kinase [Sphingobium cloacae]|uniref:4-diphosphocytidyl-2-C-methyl-D-erythritol kinase n=1 Tax=Sphingobium cloacae TaxID=120107 RepID=A0A1E1F0E8_9SPHN|nr:4-(cytidine 5'-diphospho)-2-C-methyl-D-erythritol kinase [Sphingobium cloacae]BAV63989.1 4-diphosphocytidyl-2-C-methyl-D-erythritolkinase [Sphingobium cloacae]
MSLHEQGFGQSVNIAAQDSEIAYAKINLALHVRARRDDGYHDLESLFAFAEDGDRLDGHVTDDGRITLQVSGPFAASLDPGEGNLVMKAAKALQARLGESRGAALHLAKKLPLASGIGGGSADAAAALRLLVRLWDAKVAPSALEDMALAIGSDVPACLDSRTRLVRGRGEKLEDREVPGLAGLPLLLVNPGVALSTGRVFAGWDGVDRGPLGADDLARLCEEGRNDLEAAAMAVAPAICDVLDALSRWDGRRLSRMSGSGATCFALFDTGEQRQAAASGLRIDHPGWWIMETRIRTA